MRSNLFILFLLTVGLVSCKVTERQVVGVYHLKNAPKTQLTLRKDRTFEFVKNFAAPGPAFLPDSTEMNFRTSGNWELATDGNILLNSAIDIHSADELEKDSIIPNTTITSFSFWNLYGDPVSIRFMKFPEDKIKLYKANSISFFAGDFSKTDTLEFHFYGYRPVKWPGKFPRNMADNFSHHITLYEEVRPGYFNNFQLQARRNKCVSSDKSYVLYKMQ